jgi:transcriptional regulator with XRE-family HTH domain
MREAKGLSQTKLAQKANLNPATVNRIEKGRRSVHIKTLESVAEALDVDVVEFFRRTND